MRENNNLFTIYEELFNYSLSLGDGMKFEKFMNMYDINNPGIYNINGKDIEYYEDADKTYIKYNDVYYYYNSDNTYYNNLKELVDILNN